MFFYSMAQNWKEKVASGDLKPFDFVRVVGCSGDASAGILSFDSMARPRSIQPKNAAMVGQPQPLVDSRNVGQRRKRKPSHTDDDLQGQG